MQNVNNERVRKVNPAKKDLVKIDNELKKLDKKRVKLFEPYEDEITVNELREIGSIKINLNDKLINYLSNEEGVSLKGMPSSFMLRNIEMSVLNLDMVI
ncbi:hypothetical protein FDC50_14565 [Clostridium botulinum]|nr:hypothetical protein KU41_12430 [Clostridium botulinum]MBY6802489.1 hypothetical protein [Clostridium botulinum]MBY6812626.1 hypothetical protein [Clostridium botulinum]MBY6819266.1 hypothetical protein [Clostridium botulinum]NFJ50681.1 hypothetical protein [Clostridium botulinum]